MQHVLPPSPHALSYWRPRRGRLWQRYLPSKAARHKSREVTPGDPGEPPRCVQKLPNNFRPRCPKAARRAISSTQLGRVGPQAGMGQIWHMFGHNRSDLAHLGHWLWPMLAQCGPKLGQHWPELADTSTLRPDRPMLVEHWRIMAQIRRSVARSGQGWAEFRFSGQRFGNRSATVRRLVGESGAHWDCQG